jgi:hypothetical protein
VLNDAVYLDMDKGLNEVFLLLEEHPQGDRWGGPKIGPPAQTPPGWRGKRNGCS